jgi:hypothetical protein
VWNRLSEERWSTGNYNMTGDPSYECGKMKILKAILPVMEGDR